MFFIYRGDLWLVHDVACVFKTPTQCQTLLRQKKKRQMIALQLYSMYLLHRLGVELEFFFYYYSIRALSRGG